ncbi:MAG: enoyl-CoA hydratase-related protein [Caulobacteraceae bacterium]
MSEHVSIGKAGGVLTLTLNRPEKKNALTRPMYAAMGEAIDAAELDADVRCILIQSEGDTFTAGNDIADFANVNTGGEDVEAGLKNNPLLAALGRAKTPIVAAVQGKAVGIGVTMLLHCDLVFVAEDALLITPFVNLALVPEAASSLLLPARIGHVRAFSMFVLGEPVDGRTAVAWGLANAALPAGELRNRARAAADAIAARAPAAVAITKALMRDPQAIAGRMDEERDHFLSQLKSPEAKEAFLAFQQKRPPNFTVGRSPEVAE